MKNPHKILFVPLAIFLSTTVIARAADESAVQTRFGSLSVVSDSGESKLLFNGQQVTHPKSPDFDMIESAFSLELAKKFSAGDADVVLLTENSGGTACPMTYSFVTVNAHGATVTSPVADSHCSDIYEVSQRGNRIVLKVGQKTFAYENGRVR